MLFSRTVNPIFGWKRKNFSVRRENLLINFRCGFHLNRFMQENQLDLTALSRFRLEEKNALQESYAKCFWKKYNIRNNKRDCISNECKNVQFN